jgi:hypothetical protein
MHSTIDSSGDPFRPVKAGASLHDLMQDCCGMAELTPPDYSLNPEHLDGFGR